ncbi:MAG: RNA-binding protein [Rhodospirillum sp.]|nr:RNA-binding protein [Rhodospirillum sp.]MCF8490464.1 RNA-binding protein [Rhodospirillum sp.]MCF8500839.1 RNA-binding protein [Rhodospirillum sp.]
MANKSLFTSLFAMPGPRPDRVNRDGAPAYGLGQEGKLAQLAVTGTLNETFYGRADGQLADVLEAARAVAPWFLAQAAVYARQTGAMKDMPALLTAYLTVVDPDLAVRVFGRVIDNGRMLRSFVQVMRSGRVGRSSLGTRPKRMVQRWLDQASTRALMAAATGQDPSLADIVKMVHPKPGDASRRAFYGWLLGKPHDVGALPPEVAAFEAWKRDPSRELPPVPFEWLTAFPLTTEQWVTIAKRMGWQALRMNLNTLARHGVFEVEGAIDVVVARLSDREALHKVRPMPYQLMVALSQVDAGVPLEVRSVLEDALDRSVSGVASLGGRVVVCPDVSGSMTMPVTGYRKGASSRVRCVDVAALLAAAILRGTPGARVLPFEGNVVPLRLEPGASVAVNAARLASVGGGGTNVSAPLAKLNAERAKVDLVVIVSDNESWVDANRYGATATMRQWNKLKDRNPEAKLICVDIAPYGTTQAASRADILNVGGFSDAVFDAIARFHAGETGNWVDVVKQTEV